MKDFFHRPRRLRKSKNMRRMFREHSLRVDNLIYPIFVVPGSGVKKEVKSMPGIFQVSIDKAIEECKEVKKLGIPAVILFGIPEKKDEEGSGAYVEEGIIQKALREIKNKVPDLILITDLCFCEYTTHGHCGIIENNDVNNDKTLGLIEKTAISQAKAGADIIAPSGMMDGAVHVIRDALDENSFDETPILSYSAKFSSAYYGPFRDAAESAPQFGDRKTYQMDPANISEAMREIAIDIEEGADIVMVKPALSYMDIIRKAADQFDIPIAAYSVSGEYSMIKAAAKNGWIDEKALVLETISSMKRAGANLILTYFAKDLAKYLSE